MPVRRIPAGNLVALLVHDNDRRFKVADINYLGGVYINISGPIEVIPLRQVASFEREES